jgi:plasmid stabilization system protein ParE
VSFKRIAAAEFREARDWYEARREGLGVQFAECVDEAVTRAAAAPERCQLIQETIRRALVRRFPYAVFFVTESSRIVVLAVFHCARDPEEWQRRK